MLLALHSSLMLLWLTHWVCCWQAKNPARDLPIALFTSLGVSSILYFLMSAAITLMVPWQLIDLNAPFSEAFLTLGMNWMAQLVSIGAVIAIGSVLLVRLLARHHCLACHEPKCASK